MTGCRLSLNLEILSSHAEGPTFLTMGNGPALLKNKLFSKKTLSSLRSTTILEECQSSKNLV